MAVSEYKIICGIFSVAFIVWLGSIITISQSDVLDETKEQRLMETMGKLNATREILMKLRKITKQLENQLDQESSKVENELTTTQSLLPVRFKSNIRGAIKLREPSLRYEKLRRQVMVNIKEYYNFLKYEAGNLEAESGVKFTKLLDMSYDLKLFLLNDLERLRTVDGFDEWRIKESNRLDQLVKTRFENQQNPKDCSKARKLLTYQRNECGFSCQIHHIVSSFTLAYEDGRTLLMQPKNWNYYKNGYEKIFQPFSRTCENDNSNTDIYWPDKNNSQVIGVLTTYFEQDEESLKLRPKFFPSAIPSDLAPSLIKFHGDASAWWAGQILQYLMRLRPQYQNQIDAGMERLGFRRPIVGVHIRRTDKLIREAGYYPLKQYMEAVDEYFDKLEMKQHVEKRRIFLATDDPKVIEEARKHYSHYEIVADYEATKKASNLTSRYSKTSLMGFLLDFHLLIKSDYIVCTLSSEVCRVAYELLQMQHLDASDRLHSLDFIYYFNGHPPYYYETTIAHIPRFSNEIAANVGDELEIFTGANHQIGLIHVKNIRTNETGLVPRFKLKRRPEIVDFSLYKTKNKISLE